nr:PREDICTED: nyctalopin-like [Latimeria chalumnae]|eukprot:XP_014351734.1 PREDICTED: nyctalopin-like [Latimeria chalumnae]
MHNHSNMVRDATGPILTRTIQNYTEQNNQSSNCAGVTKKKYNVILFTANVVLSLICADTCKCSEKQDTIYCNGAGFKTPPKEMPASAVSLNFAENSFRILIFNSFGNMSKLQVLWLDGNDLTFIYPRAFVALIKLRELSLSRNWRLSYLHPNTFQGLKNLLILNLSKCNIFKIHPLVFSYLTSLKTLDLSSNKMRYIPEALRNLPNITSLSLEKNLIEAIGKYSLKYLKTLQELNLKRNKIWVIQNDAFNHPNKLSVLNLGHNCISYLPNQLFEGLSWLKVMHLEANKILKISCSFSSLTNLRKLHLNNNRISSIAKYAFNSLKQLELLHLSKNNLTFLPNYLFLPLVKLRYAFLAHNPWICDCNLMWLFDWIPRVYSWVKIKEQ